MDSYDYAALQDSLLEPLQAGGSGRYIEAVFDHQLDQAVHQPVQRVAQPSILLFDGILLHRPELAGYWDYSIFLDVSRRETLVRNIARAGGNDISPDPADPIHARYVEGQNLYLAQCKPKQLATHVINNEHFDRPFFDDPSDTPEPKQ
jgi:uridine kinase